MNKKNIKESLRKYLNENDLVNKIIQDITYFETSQGSKYIRLSDGRIRRWKSNHSNTGGEDMGLHAWHQNSIFVEPKYEKEANSVQLIQNYYNLKDLGLSKNKDGKMVLMLYKDNVWKPATWSDAAPKYVKEKPEFASKIIAWEYKKEPTIGYHVVDFDLENGRIKSYHFGSDVSKVEQKGKLSDDIKKLFFPSTIREYFNEQKLFENSKLNRLLDFEVDEVKIDDDYAHAELNIEQLSDGEVSIYISEIWSDIKEKGYATKLLNKLKTFSDKTGVPLSLRASISNNIKTSAGMNQQRLVDWYIKNGFRISEEYNNFETDSSAPFMVYNK